jgi:hypothetical protein
MENRKTLIKAAVSILMSLFLSVGCVIPQRAPAPRLTDTTAKTNANYPDDDVTEFEEENIATAKPNANYPDDDATESTEENITTAKPAESGLTFVDPDGNTLLLHEWLADYQAYLTAVSDMEHTYTGDYYEFGDTQNGVGGKTMYAVATSFDTIPSFNDAADYEYGLYKNGVLADGVMNLVLDNYRAVYYGSFTNGVCNGISYVQIYDMSADAAQGVLIGEYFGEVVNGEYADESLIIRYDGGGVATAADTQAYYPEYVTCWSCDGDGWRDCTTCNGSGEYYDYTGHHACYVCDGTGDRICLVCGGGGSLLQ